MLQDLVHAETIDSQEQQGIIGVLANAENCIVCMYRAVKVDATAAIKVTTTTTTAALIPTVTLPDVKLPKFGDICWKLFGIFSMPL